MSLDLVLIPGTVYPDGTAVDRAELRKGAKPTISLVGTLSTDQISDCAITAAKVKPGAYFYGTTGGTADVITVDTTCNLASLTDCAVIVFKTGANPNTTIVTLAVDSTGAKALRKVGDHALVAGELAANMIVEAHYNSSYDTAAGAWVMSSTSVADIGGPGGLTPGAASATKVTTPGAGTFVVPDGVYVIYVECVGGGGGGGFSGTGKGGGGGGYCYKRWDVTPGQSIAYTIGAAGTRESSFGGADATAGGNTVFNTTQIANGGASGATSTGGSFSGADYGFDGSAGTTIGGGSDAVKFFGGRAMHAASIEGSMYSGAGVRGGGGGGDQDVTGNDSTNGGDGLLIIRW